MESPQSSKHSISDPTAVVPSPAPAAQPSAIENASTSSRSSPSIGDTITVVPRLAPQTPIQSALASSNLRLQASFKVGVYNYDFRVPKEGHIRIFGAYDKGRMSTYVGVFDQQLKTQIDGHLEALASVSPGKGVYRVAEILTVMNLLCEKATPEEVHHGSLPYVLHNHLRLMLKDALYKEMVMLHGILSSNAEASCVLQEYYYSIAVYSAWWTCYRKHPNGQIIETRLASPCQESGGFRFRFQQNDLDDLFVPWEWSGRINRLGLWFETHPLQGLARLDGWCGPVPRPSDMGRTDLMVTQPLRQQDAGKALRTGQPVAPLDHSADTEGSVTEIDESSQSGSEGCGPLL